MMRADRLISPDGREWLVNSITSDAKVLLERLDRRPREHRMVWKDRSEVETWQQPDPAGDESRRRELALAFAHREVSHA